MLILCLGGARSGKSSLALELARRSGAEVTFVATCPRIDGDDDLGDRIEVHRAERPPEWRTVEEEHDLVAALEAAADSCCVIDCLTLWVSNLIHRGDDDASITQAAERAAAAARRRSDGGATTVVVSNEVGSGVHPATELGRRYRDQLGRVNQIWAAAADRTLLLVAGRALELHDPLTILDDTIPVDTIPDDTIPDDTIPDDTIPADTR